MFGIVQWIGEVIILYLLALLVSFLIVLAVVRSGSKTVMKFLGADFFTFNVKKRLKIVSMISAVLALVITVFLCLC